VPSALSLNRSILAVVTSKLPSSTTTAPPSGSHSRARSGPLSTAACGADLGLERDRRERGGLDRAGERRQSRCREEVVGERERMQRAALERTGDRHLAYGRRGAAC
jgi:hypothetical protein